MGIISYNSCLIFHYKFFQSLQHRLAFCEKGRSCEISPGWILALVFTGCVIVGMWPFLCCWGSVRGERRRKELEKQGSGKRRQSSEGREKEVGRPVTGPAGFQCPPDLSVQCLPPGFCCQRYQAPSGGWTHFISISQLFLPSALMTNIKPITDSVLNAIIFLQGTVYSENSGVGTSGWVYEVSV